MLLSVESLLSSCLVGGSRNTLRRQVGGDSKYEVEFGYSRAVRVGSIVLVAATSGSDQPEPELAPDTYAQAKRAIQKINEALESLGFGLDDVVRLRVFAKRELGLEDFKRAYREFFADIRPALSLVYVSGFPSDKTILEIEAEALKDG